MVSRRFVRSAGALVGLISLAAALLLAGLVGTYLTLWWHGALRVT